MFINLLVVVVVAAALSFLLEDLHAEGYEHFCQFVTFCPHPSLSLSGPPFLLIVVMGLGSITFNTSLFIYLFCRHLLSLLHSLSLFCVSARWCRGGPARQTNQSRIESSKKMLIAVIFDQSLPL